MAILEGELTSVAMCWRLERRDGAGIGLTSHDSWLSRDGVRYEATPGITPAAVSRSAGIEPHSGEVAGALSTDALTEDDLALGRWEGAQVQLSLVDWQSTDGEPIRLVGGELANIAIDGDGFTAELQGAAVRLDQPVCPATSAECRAEFGDKRCRVDLAGRTRAASVVGADATALTLDTALDDRFVLGRLRFMSGANCGLSAVILGVDGATVQIRELPRAAVETGCRVEVREGCDKRLTTCAGRFANAENFRGEPYLPGNDLLTRYPGA